MRKLYPSLFCLLWFSSIAWFCVIRRIIYTVNTEKKWNNKISYLPSIHFLNSVMNTTVFRTKLNTNYLLKLGVRRVSHIAYNCTCSYFEPAIKLTAVFKWALAKKVAPAKKSRASKKKGRASKKKGRASKKKKSRQQKKVAPAKKKGRASKKKGRASKKKRSRQQKKKVAPAKKKSRASKKKSR